MKVKIKDGSRPRVQAKPFNAKAQGRSAAEPQPAESGKAGNRKRQR
jgi:hypothetical protein